MDKENIIEMLNCDNSGEVQQKGIELALAENDLDFVMYHSSNPMYATNCVRQGTVGCLETHMFEL